ncbi:MAG: putative transcriptional regulatory protein pdtaR [Stenotrophomonas maltophilia]|uniref:Putative transcriptional regulatory protein pdtaR n=1 Tax=Stenotrophomonas maltophilia TaxID=40324 RepID=A0A7V8JJW0_STEMA|nr:MAG: putative transcriptional regulatory protein pdtaR [Stenotrophomonas maltophilia]
MTALRDLRVLVVENDEMSAAPLQMQLVQAGASVVGLAASVAESLRLLEQSAPDVALLDYRLAHNETSEPVARALRARGIPFVLATGMTADQLPSGLGDAVLLVKPYYSADLVAALSRALGRTHERV